MKNLKRDYEQIKASEALKERIEKTMKKERSIAKVKHTMRLSGGVAAGILAIGILSVNVSPELAYAMSDVPVIGSAVRVVTFERYVYKDKGYDAEVATPEINGLADKSLEDKLNSEFKENAKAIIAQYEKDVKEVKERFGDEETIHMGVTSDYIIKTDNDDILAIDLYILNTAGSSSTVHSFYTVDKKNGELLTLRGLFEKNSDYVGILSDYIKNEMKRENDENDGLYTLEGEFGFEKIKDDQNFYIDENGKLVICFDKYEVAAGAQGSPEFVIPSDIIKNIAIYSFK